MTRRGASLIEILIATMVVSFALLPLLSLNTSSNQAMMDSFYEYLAIQLAAEPLEVFRSVGYPACTKLENYPIGKTVQLAGGDWYPVEARQFERTIELDSSSWPYMVTVSVKPVPSSKAEKWLHIRDEGVVMKGTVPNVW